MARLGWAGPGEARLVGAECGEARRGRAGRPGGEQGKVAWAVGQWMPLKIDPQNVWFPGGF